MSHTDADQAAANAVVAHHSELTAALNHRVALLRTGAGADDQQWLESRKALAAFLREEVLPHAAAEEQALYPLAAAQDTGRLLIEGMNGEHRAIEQLVAELEAAVTAIDAAGTGRAIAALFQVHLDKENNLVLPLLLSSDDVSVADALAGMHELLGAASDPAAHTAPAEGGSAP